MRVYEAIVKGLEGVGVDAAFGGAGENAASLLLALKHSTKIRPVIVRHEQAASFMACGYAIYSNRLGVCFATAGPGAFNLFSGLAVAMSDSYPVLAISGFARLEMFGEAREAVMGSTRIRQQVRLHCRQPCADARRFCATGRSVAIRYPCQSALVRCRLPDAAIAEENRLVKAPRDAAQGGGR
jgi:thiamine pyrophosphate-dependent acetolactate synthase large subunit-like protein